MKVMTSPSTRFIESNRLVLEQGRLALLALVILFLVLGILGCQSGPRIRYRHEYRLNAGNEHHPGLKTALLVPIDALNKAPVKGIDFANDRIGALLAEYLGSHGIETWRIDPIRLVELVRDGNILARMKIRTSEEATLADETGLSEIVPELVARLGKEPDLVIVPNLIVRTAVYKGKRQIVWDGVKRREATEMVPGGTTSAVTIEVAVHARDGKRLFLGYGGIEQIYSVDLSTSQFERRKDLYEDEANLREGICVALYPWFGLDEACRG